MKRVEFRIDEQLDDALAVAAAQHGTSKAALVRAALVARYCEAADGSNAIDDIVDDRP